MSNLTIKYGQKLEGFLILSFTDDEDLRIAQTVLEGPYVKSTHNYISSYKAEQKSCYLIIDKRIYKKSPFKPDYSITKISNDNLNLEIFNIDLNTDKISSKNTTILTEMVQDSDNYIVYKLSNLPLDKSYFHIKVTSKEGYTNLYGTLYSARKSRFVGSNDQTKILTLENYQDFQFRGVLNLLCQTNNYSFKSDYRVIVDEDIVVVENRVPKEKYKVGQPVFALAKSPLTGGSHIPYGNTMKTDPEFLDPPIEYIYTNVNSSLNRYLLKISPLTGRIMEITEPCK